MVISHDHFHIRKPNSIQMHPCSLDDGTPSSHHSPTLIPPLDPRNVLIPGNVNETGRKVTYSTLFIARYFASTELSSD
jgi:hypothetical protein